MSPAEQIARFIKAHPGEWRARYPGDIDGDMVLETVAGWLVVCPHGGRVSVTASRRGPDEADFCASDDERDAPILAQAAARFGDMIQAHGGSADTLPPWLAGPVSHQLINRARALLTSAGISPADAVMAAETVDEALCARPVVEVTGVLRALMSVGMSCRWATGADEAADDYVGFVSRRLDVVAEERDALAARLSAANGELLRLDGVVTPKIMGEVLWNLRRALGVT